MKMFLCQPLSIYNNLYVHIKIQLAEFSLLVCVLPLETTICHNDATSACQSLKDFP